MICIPWNTVTEKELTLKEYACQKYKQGKINHSEYRSKRMKILEKI